MSVDTKGLRKAYPARTALGTATGLVFMAALATSYIVWATTPGKRAILRKIYWYNPGAGQGLIQIGFDTLAAAFVQCLPSIVSLNALDGNLTELDIPLCGNSQDGGFIADTTLVTGTNGNIVAQCTCAGIAANNVQIHVEVEEI